MPRVTLIGVWDGLELNRNGSKHEKQKNCSTVAVFSLIVRFARIVFPKRGCNASFEVL